MKTLHNKLKALPADRRNKIAARTDELIRKEMTMRELRKARNITQVELAKELNVKQEQISRIEKRSDLLISTLRRQVEALGGGCGSLAELAGGAGKLDLGEAGGFGEGGFEVGHLDDFGGALLDAGGVAGEEIGDLCTRGSP